MHRHSRRRKNLRILHIEFRQPHQLPPRRRRRQLTRRTQCHLHSAPSSSCCSSNKLNDISS
ncbi:hypothetical protein RchiOBHm_Chr2g0122731 [Rosa chinensis]|uniref:Uncharacterized protein n=1 Tax=Rosa chinensis TaxID=74649 RepID=A0A2P6RSV0_ROSCH|nr:hypothetical protein RchiOBHm_Chr2g0122731 [Rosa chinensis]